MRRERGGETTQKKARVHKMTDKEKIEWRNENWMEEIEFIEWQEMQDEFWETVGLKEPEKPKQPDEDDIPF